MPISDQDLEWIVRVALEARRRVKEQQKCVFKSEFRNTHFSCILGTDGVEQFVSTPELHSDEAIESDPLSPGQVWAATLGSPETGPVFTESRSRVVGRWRQDPQSADTSGIPRERTRGRTEPLRTCKGAGRRPQPPGRVSSRFRCARWTPISQVPESASPCSSRFAARFSRVTRAAERSSPARSTWAVQ